jgi:hypothetical protein
MSSPNLDSRLRMACSEIPCRPAAASSSSTWLPTAARTSAALSPSPACSAAASDADTDAASHSVIVQYLLPVHDARFSRVPLALQHNANLRQCRGSALPLAVRRLVRCAGVVGCYIAAHEMSGKKKGSAPRRVRERCCDSDSDCSSRSVSTMVAHRPSSKRGRPRDDRHPQWRWPIFHDENRRDTDKNQSTQSDPAPRCI